MQTRDCILWVGYVGCCLVACYKQIVIGMSFSHGNLCLLLRKKSNCLKGCHILDVVPRTYSKFQFRKQFLKVSFPCLPFKNWMSSSHSTEHDDWRLSMKIMIRSFHLGLYEGMLNTILQLPEIILVNYGA